jgi:hypothetical protein
MQRDLYNRQLEQSAAEAQANRAATVLQALATQKTAKEAAEEQKRQFEKTLDLNLKSIAEKNSEREKSQKDDVDFKGQALANNISQNLENLRDLETQEKNYLAALKELEGKKAAIKPDKKGVYTEEQKSKLREFTTQILQITDEQTGTLLPLQRTLAHERQRNFTLLGNLPRGFNVDRKNEKVTNSLYPELEWSFREQVEQAKKPEQPGPTEAENQAAQLNANQKGLGRYATLPVTQEAPNPAVWAEGQTWGPVYRPATGPTVPMAAPSVVPTARTVVPRTNQVSTLSQLPSVGFKEVMGGPGYVEPSQVFPKLSSVDIAAARRARDMRMFATNPPPVTVTNAPAQAATPKMMTPEVAVFFLKQTNGDRAAAEALAHAQGYVW